jgi:hypothetical protein
MTRINADNFLNFICGLFHRRLKTVFVFIRVIRGQFLFQIMSIKFRQPFNRYEKKHFFNGYKTSADLIKFHQ